jgi:deoxyribose-phosphate aldolase
MPPIPPAALRHLFDEIGTVDAIGIEERVAKFTTRSIKKRAKLFGLKLAVSMVDLTTLEGKDTPGKVASLCRKALRPHDATDIPPVAAVCVYPAMVRHARRPGFARANRLGGYGVPIGPDATAHPAGRGAGRGGGRGG